MSLTQNALHIACRVGDEAVIAWARLTHMTNMYRLYQPLPDIGLASDALGPRINERL